MMASPAGVDLAAGVEATTTTRPTTSDSPDILLDPNTATVTTNTAAPLAAAAAAPSHHDLAVHTTTTANSPSTITLTAGAAAAASAGSITATTPGGTTTIAPPVVPISIGACSLGSGCTAKTQELSDQYKCRHCHKQLHGFISGCSQAKNPKDFRDGVICKVQPCYTESKAIGGRSDGAASAAAAGLPKFLWETQEPKRKRDPNAPKLKRQRYSKQHKATVLQALANTPGAKLPEIAKQFSLPEGTLRGWYDEQRRSKGGEEATTTPANQNATTTTTTTTTEANTSVGEGPNNDAANDNDDALEGIHEHILDRDVIGTDPAAVAATTAAATTTSPTAMIEDNVEEDPDSTELLPKKKKRQRYSNETKIQVILALETRNVSLNDVAKEFNVAAGTVRGWREEADKIQKQAMENRRVGAKANPSRDPLRRIWDAILTLFEKNSRLPMAQRLEVNVAVVRTIGKQARDTLLEAHRNETCLLSATEVVNMEKFKASETWARKWARDHQVISSKPESVTQAELAQARLADLQNIVATYDPEHVYTMTSTALFYRILPHRTYVSKLPTAADTAATDATTADNKRVRACKGLKSKDRLTLYLCANETGTDKLPITCIGKYDNPACFRVAAQKTLPYLSQKQALSDAGTFQMWWRTVFLPHVRSQLADGQRALLLVETLGPCKADLLKDPTDQVRVEALPFSTSSTMMYANQQHAATVAAAQTTTTSTSKDAASQPQQPPALPQCQALEYGILETVKRRFRYRLLQEVMDAFDERSQRRFVADHAQFPTASRGLREGSLANICDAMRLLKSIWKEVAATTVQKAWQRTKLRPRPIVAKGSIPTTTGDDAASEPVAEGDKVTGGPRAKSEKRQTTREKKQLVKDLNNFLTKHESKDFSKEHQANQLEEMVEKLKNCFLYTDGEVIETKEMVESLEEWIGLEDSQGMISLFMEEIKQEMNIEYLVGLKEPIEGVVAEADEAEDEELEAWMVERNAKKDEELDRETAMELASTIKSTACKLFEHGNILGALAVRLDEASDSVFRLLRKQRQAQDAKREADKVKASAKKTKQDAAAAAEEASPPKETEEVAEEDGVVPPLPPDDDDDEDMPPVEEEEEDEDLSGVDLGGDSEMGMVNV